MRGAESHRSDRVGVIPVDFDQCIQLRNAIEALVLIAGIFSMAEKKLLVRKLRLARDAVRKRTGRCEGIKPFGELPGEAETVRLIYTLRHRRRNGDRWSLRRICLELAARNIATRSGANWNPTTVRKVLARRKRR